MLDCRRNANLDRIGQPLIGQRANLGRHRGGKQQRLPLARNLVDDAAQIVDEAHVEHPIGLVEDQDFDVRQIDVALLHQIEQPAGRGDQNVDAGVQGSHLRRLADAAVNHGLPHAGVAAIDLKALADLQGQFARRREHQRADLSSAPVDAAFGLAESLQGRQGERGRLAGARLAQPSTSRPSRTGGMAAA